MHFWLLKIVDFLQNLRTPNILQQFSDGRTWELVLERYLLYVNAGAVLSSQFILEY